MLLRAPALARCLRPVTPCWLGNAARRSSHPMSRSPISRSRVRRRTDRDLDQPTAGREGGNALARCCVRIIPAWPLVAVLTTVPGVVENSIPPCPQALANMTRAPCPKRTGRGSCPLRRKSPRHSRCLHGSVELSEGPADVISFTVSRRQ
jgi:hypothetical protein